jgi:hypothetical protein
MRYPKGPLMSHRFDPDALLSALPRPSIRPFGSEVVVRFTRWRPAPEGSALLPSGSYTASVTVSDLDQPTLKPVEDILLHEVLEAPPSGRDHRLPYRYLTEPLLTTSDRAVRTNTDMALVADPFLLPLARAR